MTNEEAFDPQFGYAQFSVPDVPFSAIRVPLSGNIESDNAWLEHAMTIAAFLNQHYKSTFPSPTSPIEAPRSVPATPRATPRQAPRGRPAAGLDPDLIIHGNCPEHGVPARPSNLQYQEIEMSDTGDERYAKYFCPGQENGTGANHSLWARELVS